MLFIFDTNGNGRFIYCDELGALAHSIGAVYTKRASHVEPTSDGRWTADMSPVRGPVLGPYETRAMALEAEIEYLVGENVPLPE